MTVGILVVSSHDHHGTSCHATDRIKEADSLFVYGNRWELHLFTTGYGNHQDDMIYPAKITFSFFHRFWQDSLELASTGYAWLEVKECRLCLVTKREQHCLSNLLKIKHREESGGWGLKLRKLWNETGDKRTTKSRDLTSPASLMAFHHH